MTEQERAKRAERGLDDLGLNRLMGDLNNHPDPPVILGQGEYRQSYRPGPWLFWWALQCFLWTGIGVAIAFAVAAAMT